MRVAKVLKQACLVYALLASPAYATTIQSFGIAPNNPVPGDLVTAYFQLDGGTPVGQASVWLDNIEQCQASAENGFFSCAFSVPHGGRFNYELRFRNSGGALTASIQQALSGGLRIVKFQPEIVQAGRSAIIFAKLDYLHPAVTPQPQGQIEIASLDGAQRCTIQLPQQTHCQILFAQAGRYPLRAQYSGDANYPALTSAISEIRAANPKLDHVIYANEVPLGPIVADTAYLYTGDSAKFNRDGNWQLLPQRGVIDFNVGAQIPLFQAGLYNQGFVGSSRVYGNQSNSANTHAITTPRGEAHSAFSAVGLVRSVDPLSGVLSQTPVSLVAADDNQSSDWYFQARNSNAIEWLSKKADGSAIRPGVPFATFNSEAIAFVSDENNIVSGDQDGLPDTFIARAGVPTLRLPLPNSRKEAPYPIRINDASNLLLCGSALALTADDLDAEYDVYVFNTNTQTYRRVPGAQSAEGVYFSPNTDVVFWDSDTSTLVVQQLIGPRRQFVLSAATTFGLRLNSITHAGQALFFGSGQGSRRLLVDLNTGATQVAAGQVVGDEVLMKSSRLSVNGDGSRLLTAFGPGLLSLNSDGSGRSALTASQVLSIRMDDDARYRAFSSYAALLPEDTNQALDVYEWDQTSAQLRRLSRRFDGAQTTRHTELLAYSRREGIALVTLDGADLPVPNTGLNIGRIDLATGVVMPTPNMGLSTAYVVGTSRNGRWAIVSGANPATRIETESGASSLLTDLYQPPLEFLRSAAVSDDGQRVVASVRLGNITEVRLLNVANNSVQFLLQTTEDDVVVKISPDGRHALIGSRFFPISSFPISPPLPPTPRKLFVLDLERGLISEQIASVQDGAFEFSGDASMIAWAGFYGSSQTGGVTIRENPYYKLASYTSIVRTVPSLPNLAQDFLVEAVVSHKEAGLAPSGIVRFDDGNGAQCDGELIAQSELAIARCRILPNAHGLYTRSLSVPATNSALALSLTASYLGDRRYGASQTSLSITVSKLTPTVRLLINNPSVTPEVSVGVELGTLVGAAFTGSVRITSNSGIPCFLSAVEILAAKRCRFFIPLAGIYLFKVTLDDPIYTLGAGNGIDLNVVAPLSLFANGFE
jgi:hypothetical protein